MEADQTSLIRFSTRNNGREDKQENKASHKEPQNRHQAIKQRVSKETSRLFTIPTLNIYTGRPWYSFPELKDPVIKAFGLMKVKVPWIY